MYANCLKASFNHDKLLVSAETEDVGLLRLIACPNALTITCPQLPNPITHNFMTSYIFHSCYGNWPPRFPRRTPRFGNLQFSVHVDLNRLLA